MKTVFLIIATVLTLTACSTTENATDKKQRQESVSQAISDSIANKTYTINFNYVLPRRFQPHTLTTAYSLRVLGDSVISYLPYIGVTYRSNYDEDNPLSFSSRIKEYEVSKKRNKGWHISFTTWNEDERIVYELSIFDNGHASLSVLPDNRESIDFNGEMDY